ncbi:MAG: rod shape-determining protein RodA, partial [Gammaproteobacteria bacterium]|nr:rod shape-determining protein RodA [Gammaproteobacteria bacterium]
MSKDFVRNLSGPGIRKKASLADRLHLDIPLLLLLVLVSAFGLLVLYSAAGQQWGPLVSQLLRLFLALGVMFVLAQIDPAVYMRMAP